MTLDISTLSDLDLDRWLVIELSNQLGPLAGPSGNWAVFKFAPLSPTRSARHSSLIEGLFKLGLGALVVSAATGGLALAAAGGDGHHGGQAPMSSPLPSSNGPRLQETRGRGAVVSVPSEGGLHAHQSHPASKRPEARHGSGPKTPVSAGTTQSLNAPGRSAGRSNGIQQSTALPGAAHGGPAGRLAAVQSRPQMKESSR